MKLEKEEVEHIAALARLALSEPEKERMGEQLSNILANMDVLKELDTASVSPTTQSVTVRNVFREDAPRPSLSTEDVLANAPQREEGSLRVRPVLE